MEIYESTDGDVLILTPNGNLCDTDETLTIESRLTKALGAKVGRIVIDCEAVGQLSSTATRILLMTVRKLERLQGRLVLCALSPAVHDVFAISGFNKDFTIVASRDEALARVREAVEAPRKKKAKAPAKAAEPEVAAAEPAVAAEAAATPVAVEPPPAPVQAPAPAKAAAPARDFDRLSAVLLNAMAASLETPATPRVSLSNPDLLATQFLGALATPRDQSPGV